MMCSAAYKHIDMKTDKASKKWKQNTLFWAPWVFFIKPIIKEQSKNIFYTIIHGSQQMKNLIQKKYNEKYIFNEYYWNKHNAELQRIDPGTKVTGQSSNKGRIFPPKKAVFSHLTTKKDFYHFHRFSWEKIH